MVNAAFGDTSSSRFCQGAQTGIGPFTDLHPEMLAVGHMVVADKA